MRERGEAFLPPDRFRHETHPSSWRCLLRGETSACPGGLEWPETTKTKCMDIGRLEKKNRHGAKSFVNWRVLTLDASEHRQTPFAIATASILKVDKSLRETNFTRLIKIEIDISKHLPDDIANS